MLISVGIAHIASSFEVIKELSIYKTQAKILTIIPDVGFELVFNEIKGNSVSLQKKYFSSLFGFFSTRMIIAENLMVVNQ